MQRSVDKELLKWENDPERKSLLLRGTRQVGKTWALRKLGETFKYSFEIDYVVSSGGQVIPIEVKAGTKGQMQSLYVFLSERDLPWGLRISGENFATFAKIKTIPLYAVSQVFT